MNDVPPLGDDLSAGRSAAEQKVKTPATWLMISTIASVVLTLLFFLASLFGVFDLSQLEGFEGFEVPAGSRIIEIVQLLVQLGIAGVMYVGAMKMQRLESWGFALAASILAIVPCISPCCLLTMPFGIWALIVLLNAEVKGQFR